MISLKKVARFLVLALLVCALCSAALAEVIPPYGEGQIGLIAEVLPESITLRQKPSFSGKVLQTVEYGHIVIVMEQKDGWAHVTLGDSEDSPQGWVNAEYIAIDPAHYRTEEKTPVYAWDDENAPKVALLEKGEVLPILKEDGDWYIVSLRGAVGFVHK